MEGSLSVDEGTSTPLCVGVLNGVILDRPIDISIILPENNTGGILNIYVLTALLCTKD